MDRLQKNIDRNIKVSPEDEDLLIESLWTLSQSGYCFRQPKNKRQVLHRVIAERMFGKLEALRDVDHINRDKLDNRRENLRIATRSQNNINSKKRKGTTSRFKGVYKCKQTGKWVSGIWMHGKRIPLKTWYTEEEAAAAYIGAAIVLFGDFVNTDSANCS